ncbi:MAG TPA: hypothetical protein VH189_01595 [Rhizomicrobium sp.]|jgi:hypothetical protein|nr:hypothetical protein [Rhizomicrobium sp.]
MKAILAATAVLIFAASPAAANMCVKSRDIQSADSKDGKLMTFKLRDGRVLVNHLQGICSDLRFEGFVWVLRGGDEDICENQQSLRVLRSGQTCLLGKFDVVKDKPIRN